jgi:hypothetical protein
MKLLVTGGAVFGVAGTEQTLKTWMCTPDMLAEKRMKKAC